MLSTVARSCVVLASLGSALSAQQAQRAVETITEADVKRRIGIIADDSMGGRATPSRGLELTAQYIATEFAAFGLKPAGDDGTFIQRYPLSVSKIDPERSTLIIGAGGVQVTAKASRDLLYLSGARGDEAHEGAMVLVAAPTLASVRTAAVEGRIVLLVPATRASGPLNQIIQGLAERRPRAIVVVSSADTTALARQVASQLRERVSLGAAAPSRALAVSVHERALGTVLSAANLDLATLRGADAPIVRDVPIQAAVRVRDAAAGARGAPNVAGILEGSDPTLKNEYIVFSAHMDHVGTNPNSTPDSIFNGADDDASGTVGVVELAEAFSQPGARPKRSLIFLTVSGEERGLWGSEFFAANSPVPIRQIVANINIDMIGRNWKDTIVVIGKEHSDLGTTLNRVTAAHPELGMSAIDDIWPQENFYFRSDHFNFAKRGVPVLFFFNGAHEDYHRASDSPDKIDAEKEARILRLIYYIGHDVGNATERPKWKEESYKKIVKPN